MHEFEGFHVLMIGVVAALWAFDWALGRPLDVAHSGWQVWLILMGLVVYGYWAKLPRLREIAFLLLCISPLTHLLNQLVQLAATSPARLIDRQLAAADAALHCSTHGVMIWVQSHAWLAKGLQVAYGPGLLLLILLATVVPLLRGRFRESQRWLVATVLANVITTALFTVLPAVGPWVVQGYRPSAEQAYAQSVLLALKQQHVPPVDGIAAIVSFPSFHVLLAVLSAAALWSYRRTRPLVAVLAAAICVSTVTTGWHYVTDVLGGLLVAPVAYRMAEGILRLLPLHVDWVAAKRNLNSLWPQTSAGLRPPSPATQSAQYLA